MSASAQHKIDTDRKPRVHITYDVETGGAIEKKEIPFVVGVMANLSGDRKDPLPKLADRNFIVVDSESFKSFFKEQKPRIVISVPKPFDKNSEQKIEIEFESFEDFHPDKLVQIIKHLKEYYDIRQNLSIIATSLDGNEKFEIFAGDLINGIGESKSINEILMGNADQDSSEETKDENQEGPDNSDGNGEKK